MAIIADQSGARQRTAIPLDVDAWFTPSRLVWLIGFLIFATYPDVVLGTHSFFYRDFGLFSHPVALYHRNSFWQGEVPLWNPFNDCGLPFLAQWNTMALYPFSLFYILLPLPWSLNIYCLGHLLLAGVGMYFLAHRWTGNRLAASVAGLAFAWNGLSIHSIMWTSNLAALAWMPVVVLLAEKAWQNGGRQIVLAALAGGVQMLTGSPEIILLTWLVVGSMALLQGRQKITPAGQILKRLIAVTFLVAGLAAAQILPFLDLLAHSQRNSSYSNNAWAMPAWGWANLLVPLFHCSPSILGVYSQDEQQWTSSYYMGIGVLALAMLAVWRCRQWRVYALAAFAVGGVVLAMGENTFVYQSIKKVLPLVGVMRYPIKFVAFTVFALPLLAAFALSEYQRISSAAVASTRRHLWLAGTFFAIVVGGILCAAFRHPHTRESVRTTLGSGVGRILFLILILGAVYFLMRSQLARTRGLVGVFILVLVGLDASTHTSKQNPTVPMRVYNDLGVRQNVKARLGESRAMVSPQMQSFMRHAATSNAVDFVVGTRRALYLNSNLFDGIPVVNGFFSIYLKEGAAINGLLYDAPDSPPNPLADFVGASQISSSEGTFDWVERTNFMPMVTAGQKPVIVTDEQALHALSSAEFNPRMAVYLPPNAGGILKVTNGGMARVITRRFSAHQVNAEVEAREPAMVVISQTFYHAWQAYVDEKPTKLWRANYAFQALEVPAGHHHVKLVYEDQFFKWGAIISLGSLALCLLGWVVGGRKKLLPQA
ncbi:MAG: hypothetical protein JWQ71_3140 [Pedosphaera sp.]|nr:hypothetical protein [Pedosphaera sp.]